MLVGMAAAIILYFITIGCLLSYLPVSIKSENRGVKSKNSSHSSLSEQQTTTGLVVNNAEDLSSMKSQPFRVFVYPLPPKFNQNILDNNPDCGKNMFASEVLFHHWLLNTGTFVLSSPRRVITQNPEDATLFYVPIYSTCMLTMDRPLERKKRLMSCFAFLPL